MSLKPNTSAKSMRDKVKLCHNCVYAQAAIWQYYGQGCRRESFAIFSDLRPADEADQSTWKVVSEYSCGVALI